MLELGRSRARAAGSPRRVDPPSSRSRIGAHMHGAHAAGLAGMLRSEPALGAHFFNAARRTTSCRRSSCSRGRYSRIPTHRWRSGAGSSRFRRGSTSSSTYWAVRRASPAALGARFGDHPVTGHFWNKLEPLAGPLEFACAMNLTFEQANLDFAGDYAKAGARACGDVQTAEALERVHADEIRHVAFRLGVAEPAGCLGDPWQDVSRASSRHRSGPTRARGARLDREARRRAGDRRRVHRGARRDRAQASERRAALTCSSSMATSTSRHPGRGDHYRRRSPSA